VHKELFLVELAVEVEQAKVIRVIDGLLHLPNNTSQTI